MYIGVQYLVLYGRNGSVISPIEILGEIISRKDRSLGSVRRKPESLQAEVIPAELGRSKIGELSDAVDGRGVELLVTQRPAQVSLEDRKPVIVLLLGGV